MKLQFQKALREKASPLPLRTGLSRVADALELSDGNELNARPVPVEAGDSLQEPLDAVAPPRTGASPVFQGQDVGFKPADQRIDHLYGLIIACPVRRSDAPVYEDIGTLKYRKADATRERVNAQYSLRMCVGHGCYSRAVGASQFNSAIARKNSTFLASRGACRSGICAVRWASICFARSRTWRQIGS